MSANLELMQKIAWQPTNADKACIELRKEVYCPRIEKIELPPRDYCDDDLDNLFPQISWDKDDWWRV